MEKIRNFCIIAHIDHGKSTLADRLLEYTQTIKVTEGQMLDNMDLEKERGITIKSHAIQMEYNYKGEKYILNLIDTPGHVDFSYEVSRSIAACEGALLVVDATQGVQAQTISNLYMAIEQDLEIIPVVNKCDMINAMPEEVKDEIVDLIGCDRDDIIEASGKTGLGVEEILQAVVERIPAPKGDEDAPLQAHIRSQYLHRYSRGQGHPSGDQPAAGCALDDRPPHPLCGRICKSGRRLRDHPHRGRSAPEHPGGAG